MSTDKLNQAISKGKIDTPIYAYRIDGDSVSITTPYATVSVELDSKPAKKPAKAQADKE